MTMTITTGGRRPSPPNAGYATAIGSVIVRRSKLFSKTPNDTLHVSPASKLMKIADLYAKISFIGIILVGEKKIFVTSIHLKREDQDHEKITNKQ